MQQRRAHRAVIQHATTFAIKQNISRTTCNMTQACLTERKQETSQGVDSAGEDQQTQCRVCDWTCPGARRGEVRVAADAGLENILQAGQPARQALAPALRVQQANRAALLIPSPEHRWIDRPVTLTRLCSGVAVVSGPRLRRQSPCKNHWITCSPLEPCASFSLGLLGCLHGAGGCMSII